MTDPAIAALIHAEARLLDQRDYPAWIALFTEDCHYWVPVSPEMKHAGDGPSHFNDDRQLMLARTHRLLNPRSFGAEPSPRTVHVISGIAVLADAGDEVTVVSSQIMLEWRERDGFEADQRLFGGQVTHRLRRDGGTGAGAGGWRIAAKRIDLINAEGSMNAILAPF